MSVYNKIQLMVYPDSLGGDLRSLKQVLDKYFSGGVGLVHILPPYPSSADRGFCPLTHAEIDPQWGSWEDIKEITDKYDLMLDVIAGHISNQSEYFKDYLKKGQDSEYYNLFNRVENVFTDGVIKIEELVNFDYISPIPPLQVVYLENGQKKLHFKTFMPHQIDLDITNQDTKDLIESWMSILAKHGVNMIRLDAVDTLCKNRKLGYRAVPEVFPEIEWLIQTAKKYGMEVLGEFFGNEEEMLKFIDMGAYLYDFNLVADIIYGLLFDDFEPLQRHFKFSYRYRKNLIGYITNHDGIKLRDNFPFLSLEQIQNLKDKIYLNAGQSTVKASGIGSNNVDVYSINTTLFEAFYRDSNMTFLAQALLLFAPGTPQLYYNDILMERNDEDLFKETGEGRSLLRHNFPADQIPHKFNQPATQRLLEVMRQRNNHPAFLGEYSFDLDKNQLLIKWQNQDALAWIKIDLSNYQSEFYFS